MKLEEGMYVRHKPLLSSTYIKINKIKEIEEKENCLHVWLEDKDLITEKYIIKASHNIIDLIEVGDYVNGSRVMKTNCKLEYIDDDSDTGVNEVYDGLELENGWIYFEHEINSIVTKEQFESMSYKVEVGE